MLKDQNGNTCAKGEPPTALVAAGAPCYNWDQAKFGDWVEKAAADAGH